MQVSRLPFNLEVNTSCVNTGVEGPEGALDAEADRATITIFEGNVLAANAAGDLSRNAALGGNNSEFSPVIYEGVITKGRSTRSRAQIIFRGICHPLGWKNFAHREIVCLTNDYGGAWFSTYL